MMTRLRALALAVYAAAYASSGAALSPGSWLSAARKSVLDLVGYRALTSAEGGGAAAAADKLSFVVPTDQTHSPSKRTVVFVPGLEFSGLSQLQYQPSLQDRYNLAYMVGEGGSFGDFNSLSKCLGSFLSDKKDIILVGESFGGLLVLQAAMHYPRTVDGVVLLNAATAYTASAIPGLVERARDMGDWEYKLAILRVLAENSGGASVTASSAAVLTHMLVNMLSLRKEDLLYRIDHWITKGCEAVTDKRLAALQTRVVAVGSDRDIIFPSWEEAQRLASVIPDCRPIRVTGCGHLITSSNFDLAGTIRRHIDGDML